MKFDHNKISPLHSRYANKISNFRENFSESALIKIRFEIEIDWILFLCYKLPKTFKPLSKNSKNNEFHKISLNINENSALPVTESCTRDLHGVPAYWTIKLSNLTEKAKVRTELPYFIFLT